jgi:hypothetical protein
MMYNSIDPSITTKLKFTYRNSFGEEILSNAFDMTVTNPRVTEEQDCLDEFVTKEDQISHDLKLAFKGLLEDDMDEYSLIEIPSPVNTKWNNEALGCRLNFKLQAFESGANAFVDWDDFVNTIKQEVPNKVLYSDISFSADSGHFNAWFSKKDILALLTRFTDGNEISIRFRIVVRVAGSQVAGPAIVDYNSLVTAEFKVIYVPKAIVEDCADNTLAKTGLTAANAERANKFEFTITPKDDNTANVVTIPANVVKSNGCSTTTVMEYWNPQMLQWVEGREKEGHVTFAYDVNGVMTVTF